MIKIKTDGSPSNSSNIYPKKDSNPKLDHFLSDKENIQPCSNQGCSTAYRLGSPAAGKPSLKFGRGSNLSIDCSPSFKLRCLSDFSAKPLQNKTDLSLQLSEQFKAPETYSNSKVSTCFPFKQPDQCESNPRPSNLPSSSVVKGKSTSILGRALPFIVETPKELDTISELSESEDDSPKNSDGFDIMELSRLDDESDSFVDNSSPTTPMIKSLVGNKVKVNLDENVSEIIKTSTEGCSPVLSCSPGPRRLKLNKNMVKLRRCSSMIDSDERCPDRFRPISSILDFRNSPPPSTMVLSKRPASNIDDNDDVVDDPSRDHKRHKLENSKQRASTCPRINKLRLTFSNTEKTNMTSDGIRQLALPTVAGNVNNRDLNNIDCQTMADLLSGKFDDKVSSFRIIDARYEYEYEGGHIKGAENFGQWNEEAFLEEFLPTSLPSKELEDANNSSEFEQSLANKRTILIFHCEFSSVRGPVLIRLLRKRDRDLNQDTYPALHYPEVYLLHEGYKAFFQNFRHLCEPEAYVPMADPKFTKEERKFHKRSRTWQAGGSIARTSSIRGRVQSENPLCPGGKKNLFRD